MAQHSTIHGKNQTAANGASGSWIPLLSDSLGNLQTSTQSLQAGEDPMLGRTFGGMAVEKYLLSASGVPTGWIGPGRITAIRCLTVGGTLNIYDNTSAAGTNWYPGIVMVVGQTIQIGGPGEAVYFDISPFITVTAGTYVVFGIN